MSLRLHAYIAPLELQSPLRLYAFNVPPESQSYIPLCLQVYTPTAHLQHFIPPRLHAYSASPDLQISMPSRLHPAARLQVIISEKNVLVKRYAVCKELEKLATKFCERIGVEQQPSKKLFDAILHVKSQQ